MIGILENRVEEFSELSIELDEVEERAHGFLVALKQANYVPEDFPTESIIDIVLALRDLKEGTIGAARASLEYSRVRLPQLRREYFRSDNLNGDDDDEEIPAYLSRGGSVDRHLSDLIVASNTALDELRRVLSHRAVDEIAIDEEIPPTSSEILSVSEASDSLEKTVRKAETSELLRYDNKAVRILSAKVADTKNINRVIKAEISRESISLSWLKTPLKLIQSYPIALRRLGAIVEEAAIVGSALYSAWSQFQDAVFITLIEQTEQVGRSAQDVADKIDARRRRRGAGEQKPHDEFRDIPSFDRWIVRLINDHSDDGRSIPFRIVADKIAEQTNLSINQFAQKHLNEKRLRKFMRSRLDYSLFGTGRVERVILTTEGSLWAEQRLARKRLVWLVLEILKSRPNHKIGYLELRHQLDDQLGLDFPLALKNLSLKRLLLAEGYFDVQGAHPEMEVTLNQIPLPL